MRNGPFPVSSALSDPSAHPARSRVVLSQSEQKRVRTSAPFPEGAGEIPGSDFDIDVRIEHIGAARCFHASGFCPVAHDVHFHLHESDFTVLSLRQRAETALMPYHGFDQKRIHIVACGGCADNRVEAIVLRIFRGRGSADTEQRQHGAAAQYPARPHACSGAAGQVRQSHC